VGPPPLQQALLLLDGVQDELALRLVDHAGAVQLPHELLLLLEDGHGGAVRLDGLEPGGRLDLAVDDELPHLLALQLGLHKSGSRALGFRVWSAWGSPGSQGRFLLLSTNLCGDPGLIDCGRGVGECMSVVGGGGGGKPQLSIHHLGMMNQPMDGIVLRGGPPPGGGRVIGTQ